MDQDIRFQHVIDFGAVTHYFIVPYRCTLRNVTGIVQGDPGDADTVTFTENSAGTALGVLLFGSTIAAGAVGTWTADTTDGAHVLAAGELIKIVTSAAATVQCDLDIELDPYARTT